MSTILVVAIVGLIMAVVVHIVVIARWSGRIDGYIEAAVANFQRIDCEITRLRDGRHDADGQLQLHEGRLRSLEHKQRIEATN